MTNETNANLLVKCFDACSTQSEFVNMVESSLPDPRLAPLLWLTMLGAYRIGQSK